MRDTAAPNTGPNGISLWLYRVARNADVLNESPVPRDGELPRPLLPVDLFYLVAPITRVPTTDRRCSAASSRCSATTVLRGTALKDDLVGEATEPVLIALKRERERESRVRSRSGDCDFGCREMR